MKINIVITLLLSLLLTKPSWAHFLPGDAIFVGGEDCSWQRDLNWEIHNPNDHPPGPETFPGTPDPSSQVYISGGISNSPTQVCLDVNHTVEIAGLSTNDRVNLWIETGATPALSMGSFNNRGYLDIKSWKQHSINMASFTNHLDAQLSISSEIHFNGAISLMLNLGHMGTSNNSSLECDKCDLENQGTISLGLFSELDVKGLLNEETGTLQCHGGIFSAEGAVINSGKIEGWGMLDSSSVDFQNQATASIIAYFGTMKIVASSFTNDGLIMNSSNSNIQIAMTSDQNFINKNSMLINAGGGISVVLGDFTNSTAGGTANPVIELRGGHFAAANILQEAGALFNGFGVITGNIQIADNAQMNLTGPTNIVGGVTIGTGATLEVKDGQTLITGHTTNNGTIIVRGGTVIFQGGLTDNGNIIYESSPSVNAADLNRSNSVDGQDLSIFANAFGWTANSE